MCLGVIRDDLVSKYFENRLYSKEVSDHLPVTFVIKFKKIESSSFKKK